MPQYAYSLNGENWQGAFATRDLALNAALQKCTGVSDPPGSVFVAEIPSSEAYANQLGHVVVKEMRSRAATYDGLPAYLKDVAVSQIDQLDEAIEATVMHWLQANHLLPSSAKVQAISEHPVPLPHRAIEAGNSNGQGRSEAGKSTGKKAAV